MRTEKDYSLQVWVCIMRRPLPPEVTYCFVVDNCSIIGVLVVNLLLSTSMSKIGRAEVSVLVGLSLCAFFSLVRTQQRAMPFGSKEEKYVRDGNAEQPILEGKKKQKTARASRLRSDGV